MPSVVKNKKTATSIKRCNRLDFMLSDKGSNLESSDPESDVLPITPSDNQEVQNYKIINKLKSVFRIYYDCFLSILAQASFKVTVLLKISLLASVSESTQK